MDTRLSLVQLKKTNRILLELHRTHKLCKIEQTPRTWKNMTHSSVIKNLKTTFFIQKNGVTQFEKLQKTREQLLKEMLHVFNEGRSKRYYCIAATVFELDELQKIIREATENSKGLDLKEKSKLLHSLLDLAAQKKGYLLKLRK